MYELINELNKMYDNFWDQEPQKSWKFSINWQGKEIPEDQTYSNLFSKISYLYSTNNKISFKKEVDTIILKT